MAGPQLSTTPDPSTVHLPRILCLHGGGVNGSIFRAQLRSFLAHPSLASRFRFVFAEAPFFCDEGVGVYPVYADWGPFRRWFRWLESHPPVEDGACQSEVMYAVTSAMEEDGKSHGADGEWVGVLGFSQGSKVAASLLYEMQIAEEKGKDGLKLGDGTMVQWRFGVIFAGRAPLVALSEESDGFAWCQKAGGLPDGADLDAIFESPEMKLKVPTVHVHGLKDEGLELHRRLVGDYCAPGTTTLVEWDGPHRVPIKKSDVEQIVEAIVEVADEYGV